MISRSSLIIFLLVILNSSFLISTENEIIFKISNKSFTSIDLDKRKEYLLFVGDNASLTKEEIIEDFISVNLFKKHYSNLEIQRDFEDTINKIYQDIISINSKDINFDINNINVENIYSNLELDLIRKLVLENLLKKEENNIYNQNNKIDIYNYNIEYINFSLINFKEYNSHFLNTNFNNIMEVENFLKENNIPYLKKNNNINNINNINKVIKDKIYLNKNFFKIQKKEDITYFNIKKKFQTHDSLSLVLYSIKSNNKLNDNDIKCSLLENKNIDSKEYEFDKLNEKIKNNLVNVDDYIEISSDNSFIYVILCDLKFNKDLINNLILNKKINKLVNNIEDNFITKYSKEYNLIITNE